MPKPRPVARNADRNPNLNGDKMMEGKHGYKMPKMKDAYKMKMTPMANSIRATNLKRMGKNKMSHNPGY